jgi:hypothetical protein
MIMSLFCRSVAVGILLGAAPLRADHRDDDQGLFGTVSAEGYSDYFFRGVRYSKRASFQPSFQLNYQNRSFGGIGGGMWWHIPFEGDEPDRFYESDYDVHYDVGAGPLVFSVGEVWYGAVGKNRSPLFAPTRESYFTILLDAYLTPSFGMYHDESRFEDWYYEFGLSQPVPELLGGRVVTITPSVTWGFSGSSNGRYEGRGLAYTSVSVEASVPLSVCRIGPAIIYTHASDDAASSRVWGGVRFSCEGRLIAPPPRKEEKRR